MLLLTILKGYAVFFALSWGPCPWLYCSEIYPMRYMHQIAHTLCIINLTVFNSTRAKSISLTTAVNWTFNAIIGKVSPIMLATNTIGTYIFFGSWCIAASIFCYVFVPETKVNLDNNKVSSKTNSCAHLGKDIRRNQ